MPSANTARRRAQQLRRTRSRRSGGGGEDRGVICLMICGMIFVLLVAVKLLFPEAAARLAGTARQVISQDADFEEAFAAVGRMVSGEAPASDALQEAYIAVFNPSAQGTAADTADGGDPQPEPEPAQDSVVLDPGPLLTRPEDGTAKPDKSLLRYTVLTLPEAEKTVMKELVLSPDGTGVDLTGQPASGPALGDPEPLVDPEFEDSASYIYTMGALPENASLEQRNLGFDYSTPVLGKLTSTFGWREHPVEGGNRFHYGVDLAADTGTAVTAFADGEVYATGESSTLGNYIMLRHAGGYVTLYGHCSRVTATGGTVSKGDKIAEVGATGLVTGPHLHFELHDGELYLNPIYYVEVG